MDLLKRAAEAIERSQDLINACRSARSRRELEALSRNASEAVRNLEKLEAAAARDGDDEALESLRRARQQAEKLRADVRSMMA